MLPYSGDLPLSINNEMFLRNAFSKGKRKHHFSKDYTFERLKTETKNSLIGYKTLKWGKKEKERNEPETLNAKLGGQSSLHGKDKI